MNRSYGAKPTPLDKRDYSHQQTFGSTTPRKWPSEFILDRSDFFPDQNTDGFPFGCTGYTQADNGSNRDGVQYKPGFVYEKTCLIEGHPADQGCDIRNSFKATRVYGMQTIAETTDEEALQHRGGLYLNIYDDGPLDFFDAARDALIKHSVPLSCGTPWFPEWALPGQVLSDFYYDGNPYHYGWHNWAIKGWKDINGQPMLLVKSWQGRFGNDGWQYINRDVFNKAMLIRGSALFYQLSAQPGDIYRIKLDIFETVVLFIYRMLGLIRLN